MTDKAKLESLLTALRAAKKGSRELDAEIALVAGWKRKWHEDTGETMWLAPGGGEFWVAERWLPDFTSSLDAAVAFHKRMLPGWEYASYYTDGKYGADVGPSGTFTSYIEYCATECLSIVAAVIAGMIAKGEKRD
jgi:hypothetical protein